MRIDALIGEIEAIQSKAENLDILDPEWKATMRTEVRLAAELRAHILNSPIIATDNPALKKLLPDIQVAHSRDPYTSGLELLFGIVRPEEYIANLAEIIVVLPAGTCLPVHLLTFIEEARQCYALGQFTAVQSLCRTILETTVNQIGVLNGEWTNKQLPTRAFSRAYPFRDRVNLVAGGASNDIYELYKDLCGVVHGGTISSKAGAPYALRRTVSYVEHLFALHKTGNRSGSGTP
jgi:hypothetical protein